ncbi:MAG: UDP-3-O-(3-hydroxymyristoyl)glucosamine N-acyltransferase [Bacteroidales bacterium]|nr:UDP-3-O-(3-hydroxymyristoyl)glucosamine N-acyltransferase [Bacteroidales bacterium]
MEFKAITIAEFLQGEIVGDKDAVVSDVSRIEEGKEGTLSFLANPKYEKYLYETKSSVVLINKDFKLSQKIKPTLIKVDDAYQAFASLLDLYAQSIPKKVGIDKETFIDDSAVLGENMYIGAFAYIGKGVKTGNNVKIYPQVYVGDNVTIGDNTILYPGVKIYHDCQIGANCIIHASTVIGSDGFGFAAQTENNDYKKIPQIGNVIIEDNVEIGSNVSVDRATMGSTIIRKGAKLDNLIQIAHNVEIGENTVIVAQAGIAGSTKIGKDGMIGAQAGIVGHIKLAKGVKVGAQSGVTNNVDKEGIIILGSPATGFMDQKRSLAVFKNLPELLQRINTLEKKLNDLSTQ